ncbi:MAG: pseudouridine synthase [Pseudomonadota bacterium]
MPISKNLLKRNLPAKKIKGPVSAHQEISLPLDLLNNGIINPQYEGPPIPILYEDENILVLDKPANIHVQPLSYSEKNNCLSFLRSHPQANYAKALRVNEKAYDRGLLYRLDFETSGAMAYIKDEALYQELRANFAAVAKAKIYRAWVVGDFQKEDFWCHYLRPWGPKGHKMTVTEEPTEREQEERGALEVKKLSFDPPKNASLVEVNLKTGLRHQIRAQLGHLGHPVLGDELYGGPPSERLWLHAFLYQLEISGKVMTFTASHPLFM